MQKFIKRWTKRSGAEKQSRGKLCKGAAFTNTPFTVWKRPHTLPKGQVKGATPRPPARAASQVRLGVWGLAPAKRQHNRNANSMHPKKRGYGGATPCTGKMLTKFDANQQFLHFALDVKYSILIVFRLPIRFSRDICWTACGRGDTTLGRRLRWGHGCWRS